MNPETRSRLARWLVSFPACFVMVVPPIVDWGPSHLMHPLWPPHARMHTAWLLATNSMVMALALVLIWRQRDARDLLLGSALVAAPLLGFFVAAATRASYGGAFTDPNGVAVAAGSLDANLVAFSFLLVSLCAGVVLARGARR